MTIILLSHTASEILTAPPTSEWGVSWFFPLRSQECGKKNELSFKTSHPESRMFQIHLSFGEGGKKTKLLFSLKFFFFFNFPISMDFFKKLTCFIIKEFFFSPQNFWPALFRLYWLLKALGSNTPKKNFIIRLVYHICQSQKSENFIPFKNVPTISLMWRKSWDCNHCSNSGRIQTVEKKKKYFFSSTEYTPAIAGGSFHLPKSILPWKDWTEYPNVLMLLFPSLFLNRLPQVALHSLWTSANFSLKMSCLCTGDNGRWPNTRLNRRHDTCVLTTLYIRLDALWLT